MSYILSEEAKADLLDVFLYGLTEHGERKADEYSDGLEASLMKIANAPFNYEACEQFSSTKLIRRYVYGQHIVIYKVLDENNIRVLRIAGAKTDWVNLRFDDEL